MNLNYQTKQERKGREEMLEYLEFRQMELIGMLTTINPFSREFEETIRQLHLIEVEIYRGENQGKEISCAPEKWSGLKV